MTDLRAQLQQALGGAYTIDRELGGGGMSRVFVAHEQALGRDVVVKVLAPELTAGVSAERFAREIATAARLQQANIVPVLSAGVAGTIPYYTMPFVKGESLRALLARGAPLPMSDALGILRDVARALAYAHDEGVIHRDIKPENILLSGGAAVVTDFGIAKAISAARTMDVGGSAGGTLTQVGSSVGSPAYMAPEQAVGDTVDHRADLYAWGVVAYELLAGTYPFAGKMSTSQLIAAHIAESPRPLGELKTDVPPNVAGLVMQCLAKQPAQRPQNAQALLAQLSTVTTPIASTGARLAGRPRVPRAAIVATGVAALLIVAGIALFAWRGRGGSPTAARTVVVVPFDNLGDTADAYFAEGVSEEIGSQLARIPGLQVIGRTGVQRYRGSNKSPRDIARELGASYVLSGSVRWAHAGGRTNTAGDTRVRIVPALVDVSTGVQTWGDSFNEPLTDVFKVQSDVAERVASALSITLGTAAKAALRQSESSDPQARDAQLLARHLLRQRGLENLRRAAVEFQRAIQRDSSYARAWAGLSEAYVLLPTYGDTMSMEQAIALGERSAEKAVALDSLLPEAYVALARAQQTGFQFHAALGSIDRAIQLDPSSPFAHALRYETLMAIGRVRDAEAEVRTGIALDRFASFLQVELSLWYQAVGQLDSALKAADNALELDPTTTNWHFVRMWFLQDLGRREDAIESCTRYLNDAGQCRALNPPAKPTPRERELSIAELTALARNRNLAPAVVPSIQATVFTMLGLPDSAFARLRLAVDTHDPIFFYITYTPLLAPLHSDPRWDALFREVRAR